MEGWHFFLVIVSALVSSSHICVCGSVMEVTVHQGDNITLYCDCKVSFGVYIIWYRNCSHDNQPSLVLRTRQRSSGQTLPPRFDFVKNQSSESYDLLIQNLIEADEGLYYCGTTEPKVEDQDKIYRRSIYSYGNFTTRIVFKRNETSLCESTPDCDACWILLVSLCPALSVLSSLLSSLVVYNLCKKKAEEPPGDQQRPHARDQTGQIQDDDVCYAALEIHQTSQRPKKKKPKNSDFSTYSAINTLRN
ncbi:uncharacterized protein LOC121508880 [Cheilinus undulatus]|uniref:uncharacterized protein LOC121508880 n=1 Tax=Cheilinus undulatus TaxID=241271 RepID=UPI001BD1C04E|nr:uncharacterized protein LOC121508880 [Cheilinus undulatus]